MSPAETGPYEPNWLDWPTARRRHSFRIYVVEPHDYDPASHRAIFEATLGHLLGAPSPARIDPDGRAGPEAPSSPERFDLVTFPEAFLETDALADLLASIAQNQPPLDVMGCVHVGLRGPAVRKSHLLRQPEAVAFARRLGSIDAIVREDLQVFEHWIQSRPADQNFNLGCMFTIDPDGRIRVCLHPKLQRSRYETSPDSEEHLTEGTVLSLVTLHPTDRRLSSTTIQPLICSDVFLEGADLPEGGGIGAIAAYPDCFGDRRRARRARGLRSSVPEPAT